MEDDKRLVDLVTAQIKLERSTTKRIRELEETTSNLAAKLFLAEMRFDTEKHSKILQTILDYLNLVEPQQRSKGFWEVETGEYVDALAAKKSLEDHVAAETKMLKHVEAEIQETDDEALKQLFMHIAEDERKHHKIMAAILKKAFKMVSVP